MGRSLGVFHNVPELPTHHLPRDEDLSRIKTLLLDGSVAISAPSIKVGVQGMGGIGKSVIAAAVAHDSEVQEAFPDGIVWVPIGQTPALVSLQFDVMTALGVNPQPFDNPSQGTARLREAFKDKKCLLVLDDIWNASHAFAFNAVGPKGRMLVTTRKLSTISTLTHHQHEVKILSEAQALQLLGRWFEKSDFERIPVDIRKALVKECGYLPLAVASVGALLKRRPGREHNILKKLQEADLAAIKEQFPDYPYPDLLKALQVSVDDLSEDLRERYLDFAVFPEDVQIPEQVLCTFWQSLGMNETKCQDVIDELVDRSLLARNQEGKLSLHDLQRDYTRTTCGNLAERHQALLNAYWKKCPNGWASGPNDGYFFEHLPGHLIQAGKPDEARALLFDFEWLRLKLEYSNTVAVINDFDIYLKVTQPPASTGKNTFSAEKLVRDALQLSAHILNKDRSQLRSQLWGRLAGFEHPEIKALLEQAREFHFGLWLRPICPSMAKPGGPLLFTLEGHQREVNSIAVFPNGKWIASASSDKTIKIWDLKSKAELFTLTGHLNGVNDVVVLRNGKQIISASWDKTLKVWDVDTRTELKTLIGHTNGIKAIALLNDDQQVVSASYDYTLKVWEINSGQKLSTLTGHTDDVTDVAPLGDGKYIVSSSRDQTIKLWDIETGTTAATLTGHQTVVTTVITIDNGQWIVSGSFDQTIKIWDPNGKEEVITIPKQIDGPTSMAILSNQKQLVFGSMVNTLKIIDLEYQTVSSTFPGHTSTVNAVVVCEEAKQIISASDDKTIKIWDLERGLTIIAGHTKSVTSLAEIRGRRRIVSASNDHTLKVWDIESGTEITTLNDHTDRVTGVSVLPCEQRIVSASWDKTLKVWEIESKQALSTFTGNWIATALAVHPDKQQIIWASNNYNLYLFDLNQEVELATLIGHTEEVTNIAWLPSKQFIVSSSRDHTLKVWDLQKSREQLTLSGHKWAVQAVAVFPDGWRIVSASSDYTLKVWNVETGVELATLIGHTDGVNAVAVLSDGKRMVSGSNDKTLKIWDLESRKVLLTYFGDAPFTTCMVSYDGTMIFAGDALGRIHFLKLEEE